MINKNLHSSIFSQHTAVTKIIIKCHICTCMCKRW